MTATTSPTTKKAIIGLKDVAPKKAGKTVGFRKPQQQVQQQQQEPDYEYSDADKGASPLSSSSSTMHVVNFQQQQQQQDARNDVASSSSSQPKFPHRHHPSPTPIKKRRFQRRNSKCPSMFMMSMIRPLFEESGISMDVGADAPTSSGGSSSSSSDPKCALSILTEALNLSTSNT